MIDDGEKSGRRIVIPVNKELQAQKSAEVHRLFNEATVIMMDESTKYLDRIELVRQKVKTDSMILKVIFRTWMMGRRK